MVIGPSVQPAWKDAVKNRLLTRTEPKAVRCVKDLIDHIIIESVKMYESTDMEDKFMMFHDALSAWNEGATRVLCRSTSRTSTRGSSIASLLRPWAKLAPIPYTKANPRQLA